MPSWEALKQIIRASTVLGIVVGMTALATFVRPDWIGAAAGVGFGLVFGVVFVYVNWPSFDE